MRLSPVRSLARRWSRCTENLFSILKFNTLFPGPGSGLFQLFVLGFHGPGPASGARLGGNLVTCVGVVHAFEPHSFGRKKMATTKAVKVSYVLATKHFATTVNVPVFFSLLRPQFTLVHKSSMSFVSLNYVVHRFDAFYSSASFPSRPPTTQALEYQSTF